MDKFLGLDIGGTKCAVVLGDNAALGVAYSGYTEAKNIL